jgi:hypothetical protein
MGHQYQQKSDFSPFLWAKYVAFVWFRPSYLTLQVFSSKADIFGLRHTSKP